VSGGQDARAAIERHSKSFALASRLLPPRAGRDAALVYAWCRHVDDAIDEDGPEAPAAALERLRAELGALYAEGAPRHTGASDFGEVLRRTRIPWRYPAELLAGMEMDVSGRLYETIDDLLVYCYRVASTVGLMMCHVMGVSDPAALRYAAPLGLGMQLTNICRDVNEDWRRGRLYLPDELLARYGCGGLRPQRGGAPLSAAARAACRGAARELCALAERYYASSDAGLDYLSARSAVAVNAARRIYSAIDAELARRDWDIGAGRAVVPAPRKLWLCAVATVSTLARRAWTLRGRFRAVALDGVLHEVDVSL
jgi:phytoene synthase